MASAVVTLQLLAVVAAKNCTTRCGNISIEYPFGVEPGCYHAAGFNLTCNHSYHPPRLFLGDGTVQVLEISIPDGTVRINSSLIHVENDRDGASDFSANETWGGGLPDGGPYFLSVSESSLVMVGCNAQISMSANYQAHTHVTATATIHREGITATALLASRAMLLRQMDAKMLTNVCTRKLTIAMV
ncbi:hypothetical protein E2562_018140 [Oryza meyeriana var. granulata]|uniref:Wall-associated receptor kinase galacturonan-binding domain-containing protein n=1 Tax=Oryza meyeriana var. granulata TaxID=110450 RepID=A0A6G1C782_9ORYZ|nr:hypothetical protein E2562_018140 [Oryza meyeriana var. granulata]